MARIKVTVILQSSFVSSSEDTPDADDAVMFRIPCTLHEAATQLPVLLLLLHRRKTAGMNSFARATGSRLESISGDDTTFVPAYEFFNNDV